MVCVMGMNEKSEFDSSLQAYMSNVMVMVKVLDILFTYLIGASSGYQTGAVEEVIQVSKKTFVKVF